MKFRQKKHLHCAMALLTLLLFVFSGCSLKPQPFDPQQEIHVVSREDGSGTRGAFTELTHISQKDTSGEVFDYTTVEASITNSTSVVMTTVTEDTHAIGYMSLGSLSDDVKVLSVEGISPDAEEIKAGKYPIARPFLLATKGEPGPVAQDFYEFIASNEGQTIVEENGYVSIGEGVPYESEYLSGKIVVGGSSSVTPVIEKLKEGYQLFNPDVIIEVQQSDSTTGMASVVEGNYDIGMSSRSLKDSELAEGLEPTAIAMDGIVLIVSKNNPTTNLTLEQVREIYTGEITTWTLEKNTGGAVVEQ